LLKELKLVLRPANLRSVASLKDENREILAVVFARDWLRKFLPHAVQRKR
jgi:hypothetical protein